MESQRLFFILILSADSSKYLNQRQYSSSTNSTEYLYPEEAGEGVDVYVIDTYVSFLFDHFSDNHQGSER